MSICKLIMRKPWKMSEMERNVVLKALHRIPDIWHTDIDKNKYVKYNEIF